MVRPLWFIELLKKTFPQRFMIAKLTKVPIVGKIIDSMLFEGDDIIYLPKDDLVKTSNQVIKINKAVNKPEEMVLPSQVLDRFIEEANYHWIMNFCICRSGEKCDDYPINLGCLFLGKAVLNIDPRLGRLVTKEEALKHVRRCREAGLVHLIGRNKLDTVWLDIGPADRLLTICNCCPCCCLWRILPHVSPQIQVKVKRMPGVKLTVTDQCIGCGKCLASCFVNAIQLINKQAVITDACRGCSRCVDICPQKAIVLTIDNNQFVEKSVERISELVDVT
ncbi:MAG: DUF362 domain-containing protein [Candidatus Hermodarchaeota archaeon]